MNKLDKASQKEWAAITLTLETAESRLSQAIDSAIETVAAVVRSEPADGQSVDDCIAEPWKTSSRSTPTRSRP